MMRDFKGISLQRPACAKYFPPFPLSPAAQAPSGLFTTACASSLQYGQSIKKQ
jgi:hypothetical protein